MASKAEHIVFPHSGTSSCVPCLVVGSSVHQSTARHLGHLISLFQSTANFHRLYFHTLLGTPVVPSLVPS